MGHFKNKNCSELHIKIQTIFRQCFSSHLVQTNQIAAQCTSTFNYDRGFAELAERTANEVDGVEFISSIALCNPNLFVIRN